MGDFSDIKLSVCIRALYFIPVALLCLCHCWTGTNTAEVLRPRGVSLSSKIFYEPSKDFSCIDGSGTFPFFYVNDDYCDCADGSDEPGTAACPDAHFFCINSGYMSRDIPSSRVNDNICDCCDGSDEYNSSAECVNICMELGNEARENAKKQEELFKKGFQMYQEYAIQGKQIKENNKVKLEILKNDEATTSKQKSEKEAIKNEAESKEKAALSKYEALKEEIKRAAEELEMQKHQAEEREHAQEAFHELDLNQDGMLTVDEIQKFPIFDNDHDGIVSEEEGKFFLHMKDSMDMEEFINTGWMIMKPVYLLDKIPPVLPTPPDVTSAPDNVGISEQEESDDVPYENEENLTTEDSNDDDDDFDDDDDSEQLEQPVEFPPKEVPEEEKKDQLEYDEETKALVSEANDARQIHKEISEQLEKIQNEVRQIEDDIEEDFGSDEQFSVLKGQCFDFNEREYTYRLCPFDRASQVPKAGGSDISLGKWGHWAGPEDNKYSKMKFENGQSCWNGPSRSVMVLLHCGLENQVLSASEPNRCEYLLEFNTPALCYSSQETAKVHQHTEL